MARRVSARAVRFEPRGGDRVRATVITTDGTRCEATMDLDGIMECIAVAISRDADPGAIEDGVLALIAIQEADGAVRWLDALMDALKPQALQDVADTLLAMRAGTEAMLDAARDGPLRHVRVLRRRVPGPLPRVHRVREWRALLPHAVPGLRAEV